MHFDVLPESTKSLIPLLGKSPLARQFYLAGGTGLALQLGHRMSGDLDFFSESLDEAIVIQKLAELGEFHLEKKSEQTVIGILGHAKMSFLGYPYPVLFPFQAAEGIQVADARDIACMKIDAVASRGAKRDFIDLYFLAKTVLTLPEMLTLFQKKYATLHYNMMHVKKSMIYFEDAEDDPMPQMKETISWEEVKLFLEREVLRLA